MRGAATSCRRGSGTRSDARWPSPRGPSARTWRSRSDCAGCSALTSCGTASAPGSSKSTRVRRARSSASRPRTTWASSPPTWTVAPGAGRRPLPLRRRAGPPARRSSSPPGTCASGTRATGRRAASATCPTRASGSRPAARSAPWSRCRSPPRPSSPTSRHAQPRCAPSWESAPGSVRSPDLCSGRIVTVSLNDRAQQLANRLAAEADALRVKVSTLPGGTRLIDCGSAAPGGLEAGRQFAQICMGGLGWVSFAPLVLEGSWLPGLTVVTDRPALACLASQYAGWRLDRDGYFAMASGPGRALIRAEELYDDLDVDERARTAVLCLETRESPPEPVADYVAKRADVPAADLTLLFAPTASLAGSVQVAARVVETALHKLHELELVVPRLPSSASSDHGEPFGSVLERAGWDFYEIDPLLFSPAEVRLTSVSSGRSFHAGGVEMGVLERSFRG